MQQSGQNRHTLRSPAVALFALAGLVVSSALGCDGDDSTDFPTNGGSGGTAGRAGGGGTGGRAGAGAGGTAGTGGNAGTSGNGGTTGGSGGSTDAGAGGVDHEQIMTALCAKYAAGVGSGSSDDGDAGVVDASTPDAAPNAPAGCAPASTCVQDNLGTFTFIESAYPACLDEAEAFFSCLGTAPITSFECADGTIPQYISGTPPCDDEEAAFNAGLGSNGASCAN